MQKILDEIAAERTYQDNKWGPSVDDTLNTPWMWTTYIANYSTKWMRGAFKLGKSDVDDFRAKMVKTAAIAVAAVESIDRQRAENPAGKTFYEY